MATGSGVSIRRAMPGDANALAELAAATYRETYGEFLDGGEIDDYIAEHFTPGTFRASLDDPSSTLIVATGESRLTGYVQLRVSTPPPCVTGPAPVELHRLYVRRDAIGTGRGAALMDAARDGARHRGRDTIWLVIYPRNVRALAFYRKHGFVEVGTTGFAFGGRVYVDPVLCAPVG
jgi:diamine N-acetyltransferase